MNETTYSIEELYENTLLPRLKSLEQKRKQILMIDFIAIVLIVGFFFGTVLFGNQENKKQNYLILVTLLPICLGILLLLFNIHSKKTYRKTFKQTIVSEIVKLINPEWHYSPNMMIYTYDYIKSDLFRIPYDRFDGDDLVWGRIGKTNFQCSEFHTQTKHIVVKGRGSSQEKLHTIFKGLFFHADFNKNFNGRTFVTPDYAEKMLGKWGQNLQTYFGDATIVKLENPDFEKEFVVHSTDQIEARYIITPAIMEAMLKIKKLYNCPVRFSFIESKIYCALSYDRKLFEPKVWRSGLNIEDVKEMFLLFELSSTIVREMDLNLRIWTKK